MAANEERRELLTLNIALGLTIGVVALFIVLASIWGSGAVQDSSTVEDGAWWQGSLQERHKLDLDYTGVRSKL
ncbi:MAG: hypothetical protein VX906_06275, partial [Candidatus Thermoplasmatota archaeon]|nr:hypothetical protein [Candidatus Thermoplasmatota archaeon]